MVWIDLGGGPGLDIIAASARDISIDTPLAIDMVRTISVGFGIAVHLVDSNGKLLPSLGFVELFCANSAHARRGDLVDCAAEFQMEGVDCILKLFLRRIDDLLQAL